MICFNVAHHGMSGANWAGSASTWIGKTRQDHIHPNIASWLKYFGTWITCLGCKCCSSPSTVERELDSFGWCGSDQLTPKHLSTDFRYILQSVVSLQALQLLNVKSLLDVTAPISLACLWPRSNLQAGPIFYLGSIPAKPCFQASWLLTASRRWNATNRHLPKLSCNVKPCAVNAVLI